MRPLYENFKLTEQFITEIFSSIKTPEEIKIITGKVLHIERALASSNGKNTLNCIEERSDYRTENERERLRKQILDELYSEKRLSNDNEIKLGIGGGGALPLNKIKKEKQAFFVIGSPSSGKSTFVNIIADELGAIVLDSDYAKRKLPEFSLSPAGADLVHKESVQIILGGENWKNESLFLKCCKDGNNIIYVMTGDVKKELVDLSNFLIGIGYRTHLTFVCLGREEVTRRAYKRFEDTGRYIPLSLIFDKISDSPLGTYYNIKNESKDSFCSYGKISSAGEKYVVKDIAGRNPVKLLEKKMK
ncbi:MAG: zeta toxin family protein [Fusobacteriaceae bacterium]